MFVRNSLLRSQSLTFSKHFSVTTISQRKKVRIPEAQSTSKEQNPIAPSSLRSQFFPQNLKLGMLSKMPKKRNRFSLKERYEIVQKLNSGKSISKVAEEIGYPRTTINRINKNSEQISRDYLAGASSQVKRQVKHNFEGVDQPLLEFLRLARDQKIPISGDMLLEKAQQYAAELK